MADQEGFTAHEAENLQHYVYFFQDPRDGTIFYVGKGKGNRFLSRLQHSDETEWHNKRLDTIREIEAEGHEVRCFIARHGMNEQTALEVEGALIDVLRLVGNDELTNKHRGHSPSRGLWDFRGHIEGNAWGVPSDKYKKS